MTIRRDIRQFTRDESGTILVIWGVALAVMLGIVAMSFDFGRIAATQSELQSYADHVALAAAGELDGANNAITRANSAAANLISDMQTYGNGSQALTSADYTISYYSTLPGSDTASMAAGLTTDPKIATYVRVEVTPKTVPFTFGAAFFALTGNAPSKNTVGAVAVAGFTQYACDISPMMFCIPNPTFDASNPATVGDMIRLRSGGQGAAWGPGDFGFLQPTSLALDSTGNCAGITGLGPLLNCVLGAAGSITQCYPQRGVNTEPGQKVGITNEAINMRFDIFPQSTHKKEMLNPAFAPAPNVIKGVEPKGGSCNWNQTQPTTDTVALPRDDCFPGCAPYGDGNWSNGRNNAVNGYVTVNYGGSDPHMSASTRYQYYLAEIAAAGGGASTSPILNGLSETGRPSCSPHQYPDPERRVLIAAGINCDPNNGGTLINGSTTNVPVHQFVTMFLTEPVVPNGTTNGLDIYAEIIGSAQSTGGGGSAGVIHDVVQLYR